MIVKGEWNAPQNLDEVQGGNPIGVVALDNGEIQVYWRDLEGEIVVSKNSGSWVPTAKVLEGLPLGFQFAVIRWGKGRGLRLYYQDEAGIVHERCSDNGGESWFQGSLEVGGSVEKANPE